MQMAAHAEGADHHDGADGIARGLLDVDGAGGRTGLLGLGLDLLGDGLLDHRPIAVKC